MELITNSSPEGNGQGTLVTPRSQVHTKGILHKKEYLPMKSSKWGQVPSKFFIDTDGPKGFAGDSAVTPVTNQSPLSRMTNESNQKLSRMQDVFTQKLKSIYETRAKARTLTSLNIFENSSFKQGFLEVCEGERYMIAKCLRNNTGLAWQRTWVSLSATKLRVYDPHTQDLLDPIQSVEVKSILHCKAEDTCVFSVESMVDDFLGSWSYFFRTASRGERDAWITAIDQQIVGQSPMVSTSRRSAFGRGNQSIGSPTAKVQSPMSARRILKISALVTPRSGSSINHLPPSTKRRRVFDDTDAELLRIRDLRESTEKYLDEMKETHMELDKMRNVLWCKDISSIVTAEKIYNACQQRARQAREAVAMSFLDVSEPGEQTSSIIESPSGRLGCLVVFDSEEEAGKAMRSVNFFATHDGENMTSELICEQEIESMTSAFRNDDPILGLSQASASAQASTSPKKAAGKSAQRIHEDRLHPEDTRDLQDRHAGRLPSAACKTFNRPAGWSTLNDRTITGIAKRHQKSVAGLHQKRNAITQDAAKAKLRDMKGSQKVELRALVPNHATLAYFLIRYDPGRSALEMEFVTNEATHKLWTGAITDVKVAPTNNGGNVNVMGDGTLGMHLGQRHWSEFAFLAKTATLMQQALEKHMIDPVDLERHESKYTNLQVPLTDRSFVGKTRQNAVRNWKFESRDRALGPLRAPVNDLTAPVRRFEHVNNETLLTVDAETTTFDINPDQLQEIVAELSALPKDNQTSHIKSDEDVLDVVSEIASQLSSLPATGFDFSSWQLQTERSPDRSIRFKSDLIKHPVGEDIDSEKLPVMAKLDKHGYTNKLSKPIAVKSKVQAAVHGGHVDLWEHQTRHDGMANPHLKLSTAAAVGSRSKTAKMFTQGGDNDPKAVKMWMGTAASDAVEIKVPLRVKPTRFLGKDIQQERFRDVKGLVADGRVLQLPSPKRDGVASALTARERPFDFSLFKASIELPGAFSGVGLMVPGRKIVALYADGKFGASTHR